MRPTQIQKLLQNKGKIKQDEKTTLPTSDWAPKFKNRL